MKSSGKKMNTLTINFFTGDFLENYRIESIVFSTPETISYAAEDMRTSIQVLIQQYSQPKNSEWTAEMISDVYQKCSHPNIAKYQDILFENGFIYIVYRKSSGISLDNYLQLHPALNETEINNFLSSLLSIFIVLAEHDWMVETIPFQQIYCEDSGVYAIYGLLPIQKRSDYNDYYMALLNQIVDSILVLENEAGVYFSESFRMLIKRMSSRQFKTIDELAPLFKISGNKKVNYECEPIVCREKIDNEKYLYIAGFVAIAFFSGNWLVGNNKSDIVVLTAEPPKVSQPIPAKTIQSPIVIADAVTNENDQSNVVNVENPSIQNAVNVENESINNVVQNIPPVPVRTDNYIDYGEYIQDIRTGLLWQKDGTASGKLNFYQAKEYAKKLKLGNLQGWRVPTIKELEFIFPALEKPFINTPYTDQKCCKGPYEWHSYWTSEIDNSLPDYAFVYHWYQFGGANNCYASKNFDYVRCVHDPL